NYLQLSAAPNVIRQRLQQGPHPSRPYQTKLFIPIQTFCYMIWEAGSMMVTQKVPLPLPNGEHLPCGDWGFRKIRRAVSIFYYMMAARKALKKPFSCTAAKVCKARINF